MRKSIFTKAYKFRQTDKVNQLEDYLTELFVGALQLDVIFRKKFLEKLGSVEQEGFKISTQRFYKKHGRPDIEIQNGDKEVILIECKVESTENIYSVEIENEEGQLETTDIKQLKNYISILNEKDEGSKKLVYLTKYAENKYDEIKYDNFQELKWWDVIELINDDCIPFTKELKIFIQENKIAMDSRFTEIDLLVFSNIKDTIGKMNEILDVTKQHFIKCFGSSTNIRDVKLRWGGFTDIGKVGNSNIDYGFMKWSEEDSYLGVRYYVNNEFYKIHMKLIDKELGDWQKGKHQNDIYFEKRKSFFEFITPKDEQLIKMTSFFKKHIDFLHDLKGKHPELFQSLLYNHRLFYL